MSPPGDASGRGVGNGEGTRSGKKLHEEPEAENDDSWNLDNLPEKEDGYQHHHACKGVQEKVGSEDTGDGATGTDAGDFNPVVDAGVDEPGAKTGQQVEHQKAAVSQPVFDVVAKDPEIPHVADQMEPATMQEHGRDVGNRDCRKCLP